MLHDKSELGESSMNGAESLVRTLVGGGVNVCFANPGTSEMHFVAALDRVGEIKEPLQKLWSSSDRDTMSSGVDYRVWIGG